MGYAITMTDMQYKKFCCQSSQVFMMRGNVCRKDVMFFMEEHHGKIITKDVGNPSTWDPPRLIFRLCFPTEEARILFKLQFM